jgi:hypothetical protein
LRPFTRLLCVFGWKKCLSAHMHPCIAQNNIQRAPSAQFVCYNVLITQLQRNKRTQREA